MPSHAERWLLPVALALLLLACALRLARLGEQAVWWDEAWSIWVAQQPFDQTTELTARDVHPPLYQWALHGWVRLAGISEFAARYLSLLWGVLTCALVCALGRRLGGARAGLLALTAAAASAFLIHWAQETRMYAQAAALTALAAYAYARTWDAPRDRRWWLLLVAASAATALTHYLGAFVIAILNLHWLLTLRARPPAYPLRWLLAMTATGALLAAWALYAVGLTRSGSVDSGFDPLLAFQLSATLLAVGTSLDLAAHSVPALLVTLGLAVGLLLTARRRPSAALLAGLLAVMPPLLIYLLSVLATRFYAPRPEERYFVVFAPVVYAGIGLALDALYRWRRPFGALAGTLALIGLAALYIPALLRDLDARYYRDDYAMLARAVHLLAADDEPVLFVSADRYPLLRYHLNRAAQEQTGTWQTTLRVDGLPAPGAQVDEFAVGRLLGRDRSWLVEIEAHLQDPAGLLKSWFDQTFARVYSERVAYNGLALYARSDTTAPFTRRVLPPVVREARPGDVVRVGAPGQAQWRQGRDGALIATSGDDPAAWRLHAFTVYPAFPPGLYTLHAGEAVYPITLTHTQPPPAAPPAVRADADFGPLRLLGYDLAREAARPGESFTVTLHWQVMTPPDRNYTVFAHLLGPFTATGPVWANDDRYPADTPTRALWPGLTFTDTRRLTVPPGMPPGPVELAFGLYVLETGERLALPDGADAVIVDGLRVE